ncbi:MAG TPA: OmpW family outer membrane protein [Thermoanaerobaculia bacterium]|nr:OmpW family outer membrane protein [Thermoanaerobaculia bacterium]
MKFVPAFLAAFLVLAAVPAEAQTRFFDLTASYARVDPQTDSRPGLSTIDEFELDSSGGFGLAVNVFFTDRISTEFAAYVVDTEASVRPRLTNRFPVGDLQMIPLTVTLQYHFNPEGRIDPYLGAGVAYVLFDDVSEFPDGGTGLRAIDVDDDFGYVINAGLSFDITPRFAILGDVKYVPVDAGARAVFASAPDQEFGLEMSPLILSIGLSVQF